MCPHPVSFGARDSWEASHSTWALELLSRLRKKTAEMFRVVIFEFDSNRENGKNILLVVLELRLHPGALGHPPLPARENNHCHEFYGCL